MSFILKVVGGPESGRTIRLEDAQSLTIGRGTTSDVQLADPHMSRSHCTIVASDGEVILKDLKSASGSFVNERRVDEIVLPKNCKIRLGSSEIHFQFSGMESETTMLPGKSSDEAKMGRRVPSLPELVGKKLGDYTVEKIISQTKSGMLFKGRDDNSRLVAIKVLTPDLANTEEQKERFVRAMKTMLPIRDRHIVRLYNAGKSGAFCWAAMEYIEGECLTEVIQRIGVEGMLDWRNVWRIARDIGHALAVAEKHGIIHRNVTPRNIMQRSDDKSCVLGDLMLAKAMEGSLAVQVTQPGQLIGDLAYMAPERTRGDQAIVDTRSDLYALGSTCYALLTGRPPFQADSMLELLNQIRQKDPVVPKTYQLSINGMFEGVILKLLAKAPEGRYQKASELLNELDRIGRYNNL